MSHILLAEIRRLRARNRENQEALDRMCKRADQMQEACALVLVAVEQLRRGELAAHDATMDRATRKIVEAQ